MTEVASTRPVVRLTSSWSDAETIAKLRESAYRDFSLETVRSGIRTLRQMERSNDPLRVAMLGSYTTELLSDYWEFHGLTHGFDVQSYAAPYGQIVQQLEPRSGLADFGADFIYLFLQWKDLAPALGSSIVPLDREGRAQLAEAATGNLERLLRAVAETTNATVVVSLLASFNGPGLGLYDVMAEDSEITFRAHLKERIGRLLRSEFPGVFFDDGDRIVSSLGRRDALDDRLWHSSRFPFTPAAASLIVHGLMRFPVLLRTPKTKCIVLDCDNTLWGGVVGEEGIEGIALGSEYPGSCFVEFHQQLRELRYRGFLLALCSRNEPADVLGVIRNHPSFLLDESEFSAVHLGWGPKPDGLRHISDELDIGIDSLLFVDDSAYECNQVRQLQPEIRVVQVPNSALEVPGCLDHLQELEVLSHTEEDRRRSSMYGQSRRRRESALSFSSTEEYLASLEMKLAISLDASGRIPRLAQLTQKTNQFNLTGRRYSEADVASFVGDDEWLVAHCSLSDLFGDSGVVGLALIRDMSAPTATIDSFLLSCRALGRGCEQAFATTILEMMRGMGKKRVVATYVPSERNTVARDFWKGLTFEVLDAGRYALELSSLPVESDTTRHFDITVEGGTP